MKKPFNILMAEQFKQRDNKQKIGVCVGVVVSETPLKINISDANILLTEEDLYICNSLIEFPRDVQTSSDKQTWSTTSYIKNVDKLKIGEEVMLLPTESQQVFFVIDRITKL